MSDQTHVVTFEGRQIAVVDRSYAQHLIAYEPATGRLWTVGLRAIAAAGVPTGNWAAVARAIIDHGEELILSVEEP